MAAPALWHQRRSGRAPRQPGREPVAGVVDWLALLVGASLPLDFAVHSETVPAHNRLGAWTLTLGAAFAPF
jgi:hypothetical protein